MSESGDYTPSDWSGSGYDYSNARSDFDRSVGRGYRDTTPTRNATSTPRPAEKTLDDYLPESLYTDSTAPLVVVCDGTGSMGDWPRVIFAKLPYTDRIARLYLGADYKISWAMVGDARDGDDKFPVQARPFVSEADLARTMKELRAEGGGGDNSYCETYELTALYYVCCVEMPRAITPIFIFIGDEAPYDEILVTKAKKYARITCKKGLKTEEVFEQLKQKFAVYAIRKRNSNAEAELDIHQRWIELVGEDHIAMLDAPDRVADVLYAILAKATGHEDDFYTEIENRQSPQQVLTTYHSIASIYGDGVQDRISRIQKTDGE